jgi:hypothetical protein
VARCRGIVSVLHQLTRQRRRVRLHAQPPSRADAVHQHRIQRERDAVFDAQAEGVAHLSERRAPDDVQAERRPHHVGHAAGRELPRRVLERRDVCAPPRHGQKTAAPLGARVVGMEGRQLREPGPVTARLADQLRGLTLLGGYLGRRGARRAAVC